MFANVERLVNNKKAVSDFVTSWNSFDEIRQHVWKDIQLLCDQYNLREWWGKLISARLKFNQGLKWLYLANHQPFFALSVFRQSVEKIPSVQSLVATSRRPNIWGAVMALGFMRISRWGAPQSPMAFISMLIQTVLPAPLGPKVIIPWRTRWVSYNWNG